MTLLKYGIASVFVASAALLACGSSTDGGGAAGASNSNAGASSSSAGANSSSAGKSSGGSPSTSGGSGGSTSSGAGNPPVGSGGTCNSVTDPSDGMCPAAVTCVETKCKSQFDATTSPSGACGSYIQCSDACHCDDTCVSQCAQTAECKAAVQAVGTCVQTSCLNEIFSCVDTGTGGSGGATKTCADLSACCATLTDATEKMNCAQVAAQKIELVCGLAYSTICG